MYGIFWQSRNSTVTTLRTLQLLTPLLAILLAPNLSDAAGTAKKTFPRLGGYQIGATPYDGYGDPAYQRMLAKLDYVVMSKSLESTNLYAEQIKSRNPAILLAKYTNITDVSPTRQNYHRERKAKLFAEKGPNNTNAKDWWARDFNGNITSNWPSMQMANITGYVRPDVNGDRWPEWAAKHYYDLWLKHDVWDAWFEDVVFHSPRKTESGAEVDWSGGKETRRSVIDSEFRKGHQAFWNKIRQLTPNKMIFVNHDWYNAKDDSLPEYRQRVNGGLLEQIMRSSIDDADGGRWKRTLDKYRRSFSYMRDPKIVMFVVQGEPDNFQFARYMFGTCLLNDGYFDYTPYQYNYGTVEWFDEFDNAGTADTNWLGLAIDSPPITAWKSGIWRREFEGGLVLVNPMGNGRRTISIESGFRRIDGRQDPTINNGKPLTSVTLIEGDAIVLVRSGTKTQTRNAPPTSPDLIVN